MANYLHRLSRRVMNRWFAGILALVIVGIGMIGSATPAQAADGTLTETMDLKLSKAAQEFVSSVLEEYEDALEDAFSATLKPLKSVTKDLNKQLSKIAISPTPDTTLLAPKLTASQAALDSATEAFQALVADTETFQKTLAATPDQLKEAIDTQLGTKFDELKTAFDGVASALESLSADTASVDASDASGAAAAVGQLSEDTTTLAQAIELAKTAISSFEVK